MADTAKRLAGPTSLGAAATTVYTVPGATTATILHLIAVNTSTTVSAKLTISIGADATGKRLVDGKLLGIREVYELKGFIVLTAAEIFQAYSDTASVITLTMSGVETT